jgi:hypothetical protein
MGGKRELACGMWRVIVAAASAGVVGPEQMGDNSNCKMWHPLFLSSEFCSMGIWGYYVAIVPQ